MSTHDVVLSQNFNAIFVHTKMYAARTLVILVIENRVCICCCRSKIEINQLVAISSYGILK